MVSIQITTARPPDAPSVVQLVGELLQEIMTATGTKAFTFSPHDSEVRLRTWLDQGSYTVLLAQERAAAVGLLTLTENRALYAEGIFGTIPELYVRPAFRSKHVGARLLAEATRLARSRGWMRLEVTTPPLPQFDRTLAFYERQGFNIVGGRKMKLELP